VVRQEPVISEGRAPAPAPAQEPPVVEVVGVAKHLDDRQVLTDINLTVGLGQTVTLIGPSGAGKTTLLRCINFLIPYDAGRIYLEGNLIGYRDNGVNLKLRPEREIGRQRARIGFVFQRFGLFPHMTAIDNVTEGPIYVLKTSKRAAVDRAHEALKRVGLEHKAKRYPGELSGGEQQRVAIARALCMDPVVMLFDEVTSALDPELVSEVLAVMRQLAETGMTMIVVTHELRFAQRAADRVVFMEDGQILADLPTQDFFAGAGSPRIEAYLAEFRT
jgi:polar amino acid transport system ATP-binding protein